MHDISRDQSRILICDVSEIKSGHPGTCSPARSSPRVFLPRFARTANPVDQLLGTIFLQRRSEAGRPLVVELLCNSNACVISRRNTVDVTYLSSLLSFNGLAFVLICACYARMYSSIAGQQMVNYYGGSYPNMYSDTAGRQIANYHNGSYADYTEDMFRSIQTQLC